MSYSLTSWTITSGSGTGVENVKRGAKRATRRRKIIGIPICTAFRNDKPLVVIRGIKIVEMECMEFGMKRMWDF